MAKKDEKTPSGLPAEKKVEDTLIEGQDDSLFNLDEILVGDGDGYGVPYKEEGATEKPKAKNEPNPDATPDPNDAVRYQYFQSENAKTKNQLSKMEQQNAQLLSEIKGLREATVTPPTDDGKGKAQVEPEIPAAPEKPKKPSYFSRDDANTNPQSDSAKYLDDIETWRNDMVLYNQNLILATAEGTTKQFEDFKKLSTKEKQELQAKAQQEEQLGQLVNILRGKYGASDEQVKTFVTEMSDPQSINIDNLWALHALKHKIPINENKSTKTPLAEPSDDFKQIKHAQGVPNSMGTLPGSSDQPKKSAEDVIMDKMLELQKKDDPFNY